MVCSVGDGRFVYIYARGISSKDLSNSLPRRGHWCLPDVQVCPHDTKSVCQCRSAFKWTLFILTIFRLVGYKCLQKSLQITRNNLAKMFFMNRYFNTVRFGGYKLVLNLKSDDDTHLDAKLSDILYIWCVHLFGGRVRLGWWTIIGRFLERGLPKSVNFLDLFFLAMLRWQQNNA